MLKRRVPKPRLPQISQRALELFNELQTYPRGSERWYDVHGLLHKELQAKIWEWPLDTVNGAHIWSDLEAAAAAAERRQAETVAAK